MPNQYPSRTDDILNFRAIIGKIGDGIWDCPQNAGYEAGLLFVAIRNVAMSYLWGIEGGSSFSRYAPFDLEAVTDTSFPLPRAVYRDLARCRAASLSGRKLPEISVAGTLELAVGGRKMGDKGRRTSRGEGIMQSSLQSSRFALRIEIEGKVLTIINTSRWSSLLSLSEQAIESWRRDKERQLSSATVRDVESVLREISLSIGAMREHSTLPEARSASDDVVNNLLQRLKVVVSAPLSG